MVRLGESDLWAEGQFVTSMPITYTYCSLLFKYDKALVMATKATSFGSTNSGFQVGDNYGSIGSIQFQQQALGA